MGQCGGPERGHRAGILRRHDCTTFGGLIALQNLLNSASPPAIVSISYGECEASNGATANAAFNTPISRL